MTREQAKESLERSTGPGLQQKEFAAGEWVTPTIFVADVYDDRVVLLANHGMERDRVAQVGAALRAARVHGTE